MTTTSARTAHPVITTFGGLIAVAAWAGAVGLLTGVIDFGAAITARLPFHSAVFAGIALAVVVAVPMTVTAWLGLRNRPQWRDAGAVAGALLIGWIVVQLAVVQTFSWLQPVMALAGLTALTCALLSGRDR